MVSESFLSLDGVRHSNEHFVLKGIWQGFSGSLHSCWKEHLVSRVNENGTQLSSFSTHCRPPRTHEQSHQAPHSRRNGEREGKGAHVACMGRRRKKRSRRRDGMRFFFSPTRFFGWSFWGVLPTRCCVEGGGGGKVRAKSKEPCIRRAAKLPEKPAALLGGSLNSPAPNEKEADTQAQNQASSQAKRKQSS